LWTTEETNTLMQVFGDLQQNYSYVTWSKCYARLKKMGIQRRMQSCQEKVKNLRRQFIQIHKTYTATKIGAYAMRCPYWDIMCVIWGRSIYRV
jgi:hypothetical protein